MSRNLLKSTSVVGSMTLISRITGLVRDMAFAQFLGAGVMADAFFVAFRIPNFLRRIFGEGAFSVAFVPVFTELRINGSAQDCHRFLDLMSGRLGVILLVISALGMWFAPEVVWLLANGFTDHPAKFAATVEALRIMFPYLFFISLVAMSAGILNTCGKFAAPAVTPVLLNICLIAAVIWIVPIMDNAAAALGVGVALAGLSQLLFQLPFLKQERLLPKPAIGLREPKTSEAHQAAGKVFNLMLPAIFGSSVVQINILINTLLASFLVTGSVSWLYYSDRLMEFPLGVFGIALATAVLPGLSRSHSAGDSVGFNQTLNVAIRWVWVISLPAAAALIILAVPLLATMFNYREFSDHDVLMSADALVAYAFGLIGYMFIKVLATGFFSRQNTKTPVKVGVIAMVLNVVLCLLLFKPMAHVGLALASSLSALANAVVLAVLLRKDGILTIEPGSRTFLLRCVLAMLIMSAFLLQVVGDQQYWLESSALYRIGHIVALVVGGVFAYSVALVILGMRPKHLAIHA
ncbi:MAG: putative peptidoglycan lipid II flippase [Parasphingorhabdus sp.]|jgi:putative peptidoglycan lipid II flippase